MKLKDLLLERIQVTAYHGTEADFDGAPSRQVQPEAHILPFGIHFSESPMVAKTYGNRVIKATLNFYKLYDATVDEPDWLALEVAGHRYRKGMNRLECLSACRPPSSAEIVLSKYQFDGVKYFEQGAINYVVFGRNQVKVL